MESQIYVGYEDVFQTPPPQDSFLLIDSNVEILWNSVN